MNGTSIAPGARRIFVRGLTLPARIGAYPEERATPQAIRVSVEMDVEDTGEERRAAGVEALGEVVDYAPVVEAIRGIAAEGPIVLVETLAERVARFCLAFDARVLAARVRVEKPDIFPEAEAAGVEIERRRLPLF